MLETEPRPQLVPLLPEQRRFFLRQVSTHNHWKDAVPIIFRTPFDPDVCERALHLLIARHDGLRVGVLPASRPSHGRLVAVAPVAVERIDLRSHEGPAITEAIASVSARLYFSIDLEYPPPLRAAYFSFGQREANRFLLIIHHLVTDAISSRVILQDFLKFCHMIARGVDPVVSRPATQASEWARALFNLASSGALDADVEQWRAVAEPVAPVPLEIPTGENTLASGALAIASLPPSESRQLLQTVMTRLGGGIYEVMLASLLEVIREWAGEKRVRVGLSAHGRRGLVHGMNVARTVGWMSTVYPVTVSEPVDRHWVRCIRARLQELPCSGASFGVLRYMSPRANVVSRLAELGEPQITLNYLGVHDGAPSDLTPIGPAHERPEADRSRGNRLHGLEFVFIGGQLIVGWSYSENLYSSSTIDDLLRGLIEAASRWIRHEEL